MAGQTRPSGGKFWVVQHHDQFEVVQSATRPDGATKAGERLKHIHGPYRSQEQADAYRERRESNTMRVKHLKRVR
jgi:hypothetical protein